jgi:two-component system, NarL family, invasion response regulator UvrY
MIRTIIADDHDLIRDGFKKLISGETDITICGEAADARELSEVIASTPVDVLVLDISLPDKDGMEILKDLRQTAPKVKILVLSMHPESRYAKRAIKNGAAGYLTKGSASEELITAIRRIYHHGKYITPSLAEELASDLGRREPEQPMETLSDREYQVLLHIGSGKKLNEIADILHVSINSVNSYRRRLFDKLRLHSAADCVRYVLENHLLD